MIQRSTSTTRYSKREIKNHSSFLVTRMLGSWAEESWLDRSGCGSGVSLLGRSWCWCGVSLLGRRWGRCGSWCGCGVSLLGSLLWSIEGTGGGASCRCSGCTGWNSDASADLLGGSRERMLDRCGSSRGFLDRGRGAECLRGCYGCSYNVAVTPRFVTVSSEVGLCGSGSRYWLGSPCSKIIQKLVNWFLDFQ